MPNTFAANKPFMVIPGITRIRIVIALVHFLFIIRTCGHAQTYVMSNTTISTCGGTFVDPGGGSDYPLGSNLIMTISPGIAGQFITVNFTSFDVQQDWDRLMVYDGNSTAEPLIAILSGNTSPGLISASSSNVSGSLTFQFVSNWWSTSPEPGWSAAISCNATGTSPVYAMSNGGTYTVCNGTFYDSGGASHNYTWNENSTMTFCPATAGDGIQLAFSPIDLEQDGDVLYIYDGTSIAAPLIAGFGNSDNVILPAQTFTASTANASGCLTAQFQSDGWWQNPGWNAAISCVPKTAPTYAQSSGLINTCSGAYTDNGGNNAPYMNSSNNEFTICSDDPANQYVNVSFSGIDLWTGFDFLEVYDGTSTSAPLITTYTGIYGPTLVSAAGTSGCLTFKFTSDAWTQRFGWIATIGCSPTIALPVDWLSFNAERASESVVLHWSTASETQSWYYSVERYSASGFDSIGQVPAAGNSSQVLQYAFTDWNAGSDWNYYRLKQVDQNGQYHYSSIVAVGPENALPDISLNYAETGMQLCFTEMEDRIMDVRISNSCGALVSVSSFTPTSTYDTYRPDVTAYAPGIYFIDISDQRGYRKVLVYFHQQTPQ